jgi:phosphoglycerate dehydrogenase-like enzyme
MSGTIPMPPVLVTAPQYEKGRAFFEAQSDLRFHPAPEEETALAAVVAETGASVLIVGTVRYRDRLYDALAGGAGPALIARFGVGHDGIDKTVCRARGIRVTNTPGVLHEAVSEHTLALLLSLTRQVARLNADMKAGRFQPRTGCQLGGKRLVVIGFGSIGRCVARSAHAGFGMRVVAVGRTPVRELERREDCSLAALLDRHGVDAYSTDVDAILPTADVVTLHLPAAGGQPLLTRDRLARLKTGAFLVNTARGTLIDEVALYDALAAGHLAGAALDVFAREPYVPAAPDKDLRTLPNLVCTPHVSSNTSETNLRIAESCVRNVRAVLAGRHAELTAVDGHTAE